MGLLQLFSKNRLSKRLTDMATHIARRSEGDVWDRVSDQILEMTLPEAQGFIRARAAMVIHARVDRQLSLHREIGSHLRPTLIQQSTNTVVNLVMGILRQHKIGKIGTIRRAA